jgi:hypothetical protein
LRSIVAFKFNLCRYNQAPLLEELGIDPGQIVRRTVVGSPLICHSKPSNLQTNDLSGKTKRPF